MKIIWKIVFVIGLAPFIAVLIYSIFNSINGFSGVCLFNCQKYYGLAALRDSLIMFSLVFWPLYIIGILLIILSITKLKKYRRR